MTLEARDRLMDSARSHPEGHTARNQGAWIAGAVGYGEPRPNRIVNLLGWLMLLCLLALTMQVCGRLALLGAKALIVEDTRARIQADYSPWTFLSFMPIDSAILAEISGDTGRSINVNLGDSSSQSFWSNATSVLQETATGEPSSTPPAGETPSAETPSPTATLEGTAGPSPTTTPGETSTATVPPTATSTPPPSPTEDGQGNQYYNYTATPQPPEPTSPGNQGLGGDDQTEGETRKN